MNGIDDIDKLFENDLQNLELSPSSVVKKQIQKKMFWRNFSKRFSAYIYILLLLSLVGAIWLVIPNSINTNTLSENLEKKILTKQEPILKAINLELQGEYINKNIKNDINKLNDKTTKKSIKEREQLKNEINKISKNSTNVLVYENKILKADKLQYKDVDKYKKTVLEEENANKLQKIQKTVLEQADNQKNNSHSSINKNSVEISYQKQESDKKTLVSTELNKQVASATYLSVKTDLKQNIEFLEHQQIPLMLAKTCLNIPLSPPNQRIPDDTIGLDINQSPIILLSNRWALSLHIAPNYSFVNTQSLVGEYKNLADTNQAVLSPRMGYGFGLSINYQFKQLILNGGLSFVQYKQNFTSIEKILNINNTSYWENYQTQNWKVDSTAYLNVDSLFQGDTVLVYKKDSTVYFLSDSTLESRIDSSWSDNEIVQQNVYRYLEIPLFVNYQFNRGATWQPFVGVGLISGIYLKTKTYYIASDKTVSTADLPFAKFNFWAALNTGIRYRYNEKISFYTAIHYRYQLNNLFDKPKYYQQKLNNLHWQWGISYQF